MVFKPSSALPVSHALMGVPTADVQIRGNELAAANLVIPRINTADRNFADAKLIIDVMRDAVTVPALRQSEKYSIHYILT